jgi:hypothetical protein
MTTNHPQFGLMCEICFHGLTPEECAVDTDGQKWDVCKGECARQAGIKEKAEKPKGFSIEKPHAFVPSDDPHFGSAFRAVGGSCAAVIDGTTCGFPKPFHRGEAAS